MSRRTTRLARDTFVEGCVAETLAALVLRTAASHCNDAELASTMASITEDEERHAALAWRTVAWALGQRRAHVASALRDAIAETRGSFDDAIEPPGAPRDPTLARCGRLDGAARDEVLRAGWRDVVEPLGRALLFPGTDASSAGRWRNVSTSLKPVGSEFSGRLAWVEDGRWVRGLAC